MSNSAYLTSVGVGICFGHPPFIFIPMIGTVITGSPNVKAESLNVGYNTSIVLGYCGHIGIIVTGASKTKVNGLDKSYIGSTFTGIFNGVITTGASKVNVGA